MKSEATMSAQPPPRKGAYAKHVQNLHKDQFSSAQTKNSQELDLLDDIRGYVKQRGAIEKQYAESILKLSNNYLHHRIAPIPDVNNPPQPGNGQDQPVQVDMNVYSVWRFILEENEKMAKARLATVQMIQDEIEKDVKVVRSEKNSKTKKTFEKFQTIQKDLQQTVAEVDRTKKNYFEDESKAVDVRDKATDADDKAKGRKKDMMSFFQSSATLKRHAGKLSVKQEELDIRSTGARNDYILALASANAHQERYFKHDLQEILRLLEGNFYEKVSTYFDTLARAELLTSSAIQMSFSNLRTLASKISRGYNFRCYATIYSSLAEHVTYVQENVQGDTTTKITPSEHDGGYSLNYEARQNASRLNQAVKTIRAFNKRIKACHFHKSKGLKREPNDTGGPDLDTKIAELQAAIRNAEVEKAKAEARLAKLREGGIAVDEYIDAFVYTADQESQQEQEWQTSSKEATQQQQQQQQQIEQQQPQQQQQPTNQVVQKAEIVATKSIDTFDEDEVNFTEAVVENSGGWAENEGWASTNNGGNSETAEDNWASWNDTQQIQRQASRDSQLQGPTSVKEPEIQTANEWSTTGVSWGQSGSIDRQTSLDMSQTGGAQPPCAGGNVVTALALFNFTTQNPDELAISENEELTILLGQCDEEGWLMAMNAKGEKGYVPENYLEVQGLSEAGGADSDHMGSFQHQDSVRSFGSVESASNQWVPGGVTTYSMDVIHEQEPEPVLPPVPPVPPPVNSGSSEEEYNSSEEDDDMPPPGMALPPGMAPPSGMGPPPDRPPLPAENGKRARPPSMSTSFRTAGSASVDSSIASGMTDFCRALYDYDATGSDEISFEEGDIIRVLKRDPNGVDDGWWMGELRTGTHSGTTGLFPSLVVEECYENGDDSQDDYSLASPQSSVAPPSFSPPRVPSALAPAPQESSIEVEDETVESPIAEAPVIPPKDVEPEIPRDAPQNFQDVVEQKPPEVIPPRPPIIVQESPATEVERERPKNFQQHVEPPKILLQHDSEDSYEEEPQSSVTITVTSDDVKVANQPVPSLQFDLVEDLIHSSDEEELKSPQDNKDVSAEIPMEIVVTAPTPLVQSPVSEEDEVDSPYGEKGDHEEMEKPKEPPPSYSNEKTEVISEPTKETVETPEILEEVKQEEPEPKIEESQSSKSQDAVQNKEPETRQYSSSEPEDDVILKRGHFVERRSSSESSSDFSLGPRVGKVEALPPAPPPAPVTEAFETDARKFSPRRKSSSSSDSSISLQRKDSSDVQSSSSEEADEAALAETPAPPVNDASESLRRGSSSSRSSSEVGGVQADAKPEEVVVKDEVVVAADDDAAEIAMPPEELEMKHLKKLENMKESKA